MDTSKVTFLIGTDVMMGSQGCYAWVVDFTGTVSVRPVVRPDSLPWVIKAPITLPNGYPLRVPPPPGQRRSDTSSSGREPVATDSLTEVTGIPVGIIRELTDVCAARDTARGKEGFN